jgi:PAS domain S-box-containing protein
MTAASGTGATSQPDGGMARVVSTAHEIPGDVGKALDAISVPTYVVDADGVIRWINPAARRLVGDVRGHQVTSVVAPEERLRARKHFTRKIAGTEKVTDTEVVILGADGGRVKVEISSVPLMQEHRIVGVFGQVVDVAEVRVDAPPPHLTPRQGEVLRLLQRGASTEQIARELHVSKETVRNHIRHLLRALGVHTRLEAVAAMSR